MLNCWGADSKCCRRSEGGGEWWQRSVLGRYPGRDRVGARSSKMRRIWQGKGQEDIIPRTELSLSKDEEVGMSCARLEHNKVVAQQQSTSWVVQSQGSLRRKAGYVCDKHPGWVTVGFSVFLLLVSIVPLHCLYLGGRVRWMRLLWSS